MKSTIEINRLRVYAHHGVMPQETTVGNVYEVSVGLSYPIEKAMLNDDIQSTLNYAHAVAIITKVMEEPSKLLEHVAHRIHKALTEKWPLISGGYIKITKISPPIPAQIESVSIKIEW
ncbi:MAG: dihydroneopterin aldolase [Muribaculaceae bacterium]|nr:dihydroneopterin aldolase [Muribaculaceae bacterium]